MNAAAKKTVNVHKFCILFTNVVVCELVNMICDRILRSNVTYTRWVTSDSLSTMPAESIYRHDCLSFSPTLF